MVDITFFFICIAIATVVVLMARKLGMNLKSHNPVVFDFKFSILLFCAMGLVALLMYFLTA